MSYHYIGGDDDMDNLTTNRLQLRRLRFDDADDIYEYCQNEHAIRMIGMKLHSGCRIGDWVALVLMSGRRHGWTQRGSHPCPKENPIRFSLLISERVVVTKCCWMLRLRSLLHGR